MTPHMDSKYYLSCLNKTVNATEHITIAYNEKNESFVRDILSAVPEVINHLEDFYLSNVHPKISLFIYPDLGAMSSAFGREIKSVDWCYTPIRAEFSLIAFTALLDNATISQVLAHEFSHVYFSRITGNKDVGNYRQSIPLWLDEGIALNIDSKYRRNFDETVRKRKDVLASKETDYFPKLMDMYTYFNRLDEDEFGIKSYMAYSYSYFCVKDLIEAFDEKHLVDFIGKPGLESNFDNVFESHFRFSLPIFNSKMTQKVLEA